MVTRVQCQSCEAFVTAAFACVYGNDADELYACPECSTRGDRANCAGTSPEADGSLYVHKPGLEDPEPAIFKDDESDETDPSKRLTLAEARKQEKDDSVLGGRTEGVDDLRHADEAFAAIVAR
jgi:hypothetical protein